MGRVGRTLASRMFAELAAITGDLPALLIGSQLPRMPAVTADRRSMSAAAKVVLAASSGSRWPSRRWSCPW